MSAVHLFRQRKPSRLQVSTAVIFRLVKAFALPAFCPPCSGKRMAFGGKWMDVGLNPHSAIRT